MRQLVQHMIGNMEQTIGVYEQILAAERDKQRAIVTSQVEALTEAVVREEQLVEAAGALEAERRELRYQLAHADRRLGPASRLRHLIELLDGPQRDLLAARRERLLALAAQIHEVNHVNFQLLRSSIDLLREILDDVFGKPAAPCTYDPTGRPANPGHDATRVNQVL